MTLINSIIDAKREPICSEKLQIFAIDLNCHAKLLKDRLDELKWASTRLDSLTTKLHVLENISEEEQSIYPQEIVQLVIAEIINEQNELLSKAKKSVKDLLDSYDELRTTYREFSASSNKLKLRPNCSLVVGNSKQKPIEYYVEKSSDIILYMKVFQIHLGEKIAAIELRNKDSCVVFSKAVTLSDGFQDTLDEFLLYSKYLMSSKKLNTTE